MIRTLLGALGLTLSVWFMPVQSVQAQVCEAAEPQIALQYLRRLSLDLRGHAPSVAEMQQVIAAGTVDETLIDAMLASDDFVNQFWRFAETFLWPNLQNVDLQAGTLFRLRYIGNSFNNPLYAPDRANGYRGRPFAPCANQPAQYDANNVPLKNYTVEYNNETLPVEGYEMVAPYWDPGNPVKVCAFDAQTPLTVTENGKTYQCDLDYRSSCGCGPNLNFCQVSLDGILSQGLDTEDEIRNAMIEQVKRFVADIVKNDRPYTDLLTAKDMEITGPISHYLRWQIRTGRDFFFGEKAQNYTVPEISYADKSWVPVTRGPRHAGVLTMPLYLMKFQTNRARANRFYNAFMCKEFQALAGSIPSGADACHQTRDLRQRCGCKQCHAKIEPMAAHWGRYIEGGLGAFDDTAYPEFDPDCDINTGSKKYTDRCKLNYLQIEGDPYENALKPYVTALLGDPGNLIRDAISAGPADLAEHVINGGVFTDPLNPLSTEGGVFAECAVTQLWTYFHGDDPCPNQGQTISALANAFKSTQGYSVKQLVKAIVTSQVYREGSLL